MHVGKAHRPAPSISPGSILAESMTQAGIQSLAPSIRKSFEQRIAADVQRQKHHPIVSAPLLAPTLIKKYTSLLSHELKGGHLPHIHSSSDKGGMFVDTTPHKCSVEKILQRHSRERSAWSHLVDEDAAKFAAAQDLARHTREEQIRIQRDTLDLQIAEQRMQRKNAKAEEVAYLQDVLRRQEEDAQKEKVKAAADKAAQKERRKEAERVSSELASLRKREFQKLKEGEKRLAHAFEEDDRQRREEESLRRQKAQDQLKKFVSDNNELLNQQRRAKTSLGDNSSTVDGKHAAQNQGRCSALPDGSPPPINDEVMEKATLLSNRKHLAAQAYLNERRCAEDKIRAQEDRWVQESAAKAKRELEASAAAEASKKVHAAAYAKQLRDQVTAHQMQLSAAKLGDRQAREEIEYAVHLAELEERELLEREREQKRRTLTVLQTQQAAQKAIRGAFDVTPKVV